MPNEVIKTTLAVDSAQFRREFQRSGQTMDQFARKSGQAVGFTTAQFAKMSDASRKQVLELQRNVRMMQANRRATDELRKSHGNAGLAALEASRAIEDFSVAGLRGALNNIPQLVMLLGGGGGLAAAFSLTAVGASVLLPKLKALSGAAKDLNRDMEGALRAEFEAADRTRDLADEKERLSKANRRYLETLEHELGGLNRQVEAFDAMNERAAMNRKLTEELRSARVAAGMEGPGQPDKAGELSRSLQMERERLQLLERQASEVRSRMDAERRLQGITQDDVDAIESRLRAARQGLARNVPADAKLGGKSLKDFGSAEEFANFVLANQDRIRKQLRPGLDDIAGVAALTGGANSSLSAGLLAGSGSDKLGLVGDIAQGAKQVQELRKELESARANMEAAQERGQEAFQVLKSSADGFYRELRQQYSRVRQLEAQLQNQRSIDALPPALAVPEGVERVGAGMARVGQDFVRRQAERQQREAQLRGRRGGFAAEMQALQLEAAGRAPQAEALRRELSIRDEGLRIAEQLGVEEQKGIGLARRKWELEEKIRKEKERQRDLEEGGAAGAGGGRIRLFNEAESRERRRERQADGRDIRRLPSRLDGAQVGLRNGAMMRAQREREAQEAARKIPQEAAAPKWAQDIVDSNDKLRKLWETLLK